MRFFSYIIVRDHGFAPNPYHGICSLATCKPRIRKNAVIDDWIFGLSPRSKGNRLTLNVTIA